MIQYQNHRILKACQWPVAHFMLRKMMILKSLTTLILKVKMIPTFAYAPFAQIRFKLLRECQNGLLFAESVRITPTWNYQIAPWISIHRADHVKVAFARNMLINMATAEIKRST